MQPQPQQASTTLERLLVASSRTFALAIPLLPQPTRQEVTLSYLLFRIADTFEDAAAWPGLRRREALDLFARLLERPDPVEVRQVSRRWAAEVPCEQPAYQELLAEMPLVFDEFLALSPTAVELIRAHSLRTTRGMAEFVSRITEEGELRLEGLEDLRQYCYVVAGIVGELLTELFLLDYPSLNGVAGALRERSRPFGEALQLVNILKDSAADATQGRRYLPAAADRSEVLALARRDLRTATQYVSTLQGTECERGLIAFSALPVQLAHATLDRVEAFGPGAKLSRPEVYAILHRIHRALERNEPAVTDPSEPFPAVWR
jgi:farnesyl-diphosphate farnesyltransferase